MISESQRALTDTFGTRRKPESFSAVHGSLRVLFRVVVDERNFLPINLKKEGKTNILLI